LLFVSIDLMNTVSAVPFLEIPNPGGLTFLKMPIHLVDIGTRRHVDR
jgi:hypothetical protein